MGRKVLFLHKAMSVERVGKKVRPRINGITKAASNFKDSVEEHLSGEGDGADDEHSSGDEAMQMMIEARGDAGDISSKQEEMRGSNFPSPCKSVTHGTKDTPSKQQPKELSKVNPAEDAEKKLWADLFKKNRAPSPKLQLRTFPVEDGFKIDATDFQDLDDLWGPTLVGRFPAAFPGLAALRSVCDGWGVPYEFHNHETGWLIFKFQTEEDRIKVLTQGPHFVRKRPLLLQELTSWFSFQDKELSRIPVWVKFPSLRLGCWNNKILGMLASLLGKPISTDLLTHEMRRVSYARVLVEIDAARPLKKSIRYTLPNGEEVVQQVLYEYFPPWCKECNQFGHFHVECGVHLQETAPVDQEQVAQVHTEHASNTYNAKNRRQENKRTTQVYRLKQTPSVQENLTPIDLPPNQSTRTDKNTQKHVNSTIDRTKPHHKGGDKVGEQDHAAVGKDNFPVDKRLMSGKNTDSADAPVGKQVNNEPTTAKGNQPSQEPNEQETSCSTKYIEDTELGQPAHITTPMNPAGVNKRNKLLRVEQQRTEVHQALSIKGKDTTSKKAANTAKKTSSKNPANNKSKHDSGGEPPRNI